MEFLQVQNYQAYLLAAVFIWLAFLTILQAIVIRHHRTQAKVQTDQNLAQILEKLEKDLNLNQNKVQQISAEIARIKIANRRNFQKYALVRFNPFEDTGGDQSFVAAILDGQNNGLVISSLHSRGATRVYAKQVESGQATTHKFSREEQEVVEKAAHGIS